MITMDYIEGMTPLTREEIDAIAEHEILPEVKAAALPERMMQARQGARAVQQMICEDIRAALHRDDLHHARELFMVLRHFMSERPEAARGSA